MSTCRFIFVTGGVVSSVGKGLTTASIGSLLQSAGLKVAVRKLDPYLNVDPGTMSPMQHGEVFVTEDGAETDLDLGHYERFIGCSTTAYDSISSGKIYKNLIDRERAGFYLGRTVQVIPHVTNLIKEFIYNKSDEYDIILCEIGGTVGDIEGQPFFESIRQVAYEVGKENVLYLHVTLVPHLYSSGEIKTKPTQHSVRALNSLGIQPDIIVCRTHDISLCDADREKIALFCNVKKGYVIEARDVNNIYEIPLMYKHQELDEKIFALLGISDLSADVSMWSEIIDRYRKIEKSDSKIISIAIVGKYSDMSDAYISLYEALKHAAFALNIKISIKVIDARKQISEMLSGFDGIVIAGGFGTDGTEGKIEAIHYARTANIPLLGICLGFQLSVVEFARNVLGLKDANSTEFDQDCKHPVIDLMREWHSDLNTAHTRSENSNMGGTMRLGNYTCIIKSGSKASEIYLGSDHTVERHRHRYEVNHQYAAQCEEMGMHFSGHSNLNPDIPEILEIPNHKWFVGVQFHPEFKSRVFDPHPLFMSFIKSSST